MSTYVSKYKSYKYYHRDPSAWGDSVEGVIRGIVNYWNKLTGADATDAELANIDYQNEWSEDMYNKYYSPEQQLKSQAAGFDAIGLNRMLMAGNSPGATSPSSGSASSGAASPLGIMDAISSLLGVRNQRTKLKQDWALESEHLSNEKFANETRRLEAENYGEYLRILGQGQQQKNDAFWTMFGLDVQEKESNIGLKNAQQEYFWQVANSESVRRRLMESGIEVNNMSVAIQSVQKAILEAQSKYSDKYFSAVAELARIQQESAGIDLGVKNQLNEKKLLYHGAVAEIAEMIFQAGMSQDIWEGDAFKQAVSGKMTKKDWTQSVMGLLKTLIAGGAAIGVAGLRVGAKAIVPPFAGNNPAYNPQTFNPNLELGI